MNWRRDEQRPERPPGRITLAINVRMTRPLKKHMERLAEDLWKPSREMAEAASECAESDSLAPLRADYGRGVLFGAAALTFRPALCTM